MRGLARLLRAGCPPSLQRASLQGLSPAGARCFCSKIGQSESGFHGIYTPITLQLWGQRLTRDRQPTGQGQEAAPQPKPPKTLTIKYPFTTDKALQEKYRNPWDQVRVGKVLEDLDSMAGNIAYLHCDKGPDTSLPVLVTASVDAIELLARLTLDKDLSVSGQVVWTGRSSLDIKMQMSQGPENATSLTALFTFVAKDWASMKATEVNPLQPTTEEEKQAFQQRQDLADARKAARKQQASTPPGAMPPEQHARSQELLKEAKAAADLPALIAGDAVLMRDTHLSNTFTCQPQQRNMHGRIFGGFLMRRAYELAFATAYMFAGTKPRFVMVDDVAFQRPVNVGSLLRLHSTVVHTSTGQPDAATGRINIEVVAAVTKPEKISSEITNTFLFLFDVPMDEGTGSGCKVLKRVLPSTNEEAALVCRISAV